MKYGSFSRCYFKPDPMWLEAVEMDHAISTPKLETGWLLFNPQASAG
jgi:hypothetical protein